jgi:branched-chain amino acid transport system permease protein
VSYLNHMLFILSIYSLLALSLNLLAGHLGLLVLCHSAFYAIGSYVSSILIVRLGVPWIWAAVCAVAASAIFSLPVALATRKLRGDAVVIASFALLLVLGDVLKNWRPVTGGLDGIPAIPPPCIGPLKLASLGSQSLLALSVAVICWFLLARLAGSSFSRFLHGLRDDPYMAVGLRVPSMALYLKTFCLSAGVAGIAGVLYASFATYINPTVFGPDTSILLLVMVLLGGPATRTGPILGATIVLLIPEIVRSVGMGTSEIGALNSVFVGLVLILFAAFRPRGIVRGYEFK